jgi:hypothetical protein
VDLGLCYVIARAEVLLLLRLQRLPESEKIMKERKTTRRERYEGMTGRKKGGTEKKGGELLCRFFLKIHDFCSFLTAKYLFHKQKSHLS